MGLRAAARGGPRGATLHAHCRSARRSVSSATSLTPCSLRLRPAATRADRHAATLRKAANARFVAARVVVAATAAARRLRTVCVTSAWIARKRSATPQRWSAACRSRHQRVRCAHLQAQRPRFRERGHE